MSEELDKGEELMRYRLFWLRHSIFLLILTMLVVGCAGFPTPTPHPTPVSSPPVPVGTVSSTVNSVITQVLMNMHQHAWNPDAVTRGADTGGLFINWKMGDPTNRNAVRPGPDGNTQHNHDPQVDLL